ncbi:MAG: hypothetical protein J3Q66DRAFT_409118 [Benniella sp.]|nr:MAG: hypothetical protein J3Q66DRAFT_409118 [Benniella sp.]
MSDPVSRQYVPPPERRQQPQPGPESTSVWMDESDEQSQGGNDSHLPKSIRLYFGPKREVIDDDPKMPIHVEFLPDVQELVVVDASLEPIRFDLDMSLTEEIYNVSVTVDLTHLDMAKIDHISFRHCSECDSGAPEVCYIHQHEDSGVMYGRENGSSITVLIKKSTAYKTFTSEELQELQALCTPEQKKLTLELHRQHINGDQYLEMKIQSSPDESPGSIKLLFITLQSTSFKKPHNAGPMSIDVCHSTNLEDPDSPAMPARIVHFSVSGDENYVATLSVRNRTLNLDVWCLTQGCTVVGRRGHQNFTMLDPVPFSTDGVEDIPRLGVSASFDASSITVIDTKSHLSDPFHVFSLYGSRNEGTGNSVNSRLKGFRGFGKFHSTSSRETVEDELFITCDGFRVNIFDQFLCEMIRSITISEGEPIRQPWRLIEGIGGNYFSWTDKDDILLVCDLATGNLIYSLSSFKGTAFFSRDGPLMMCFQDSGTITTRWSESGSLLATTDVFGQDNPPSFLTFIKHRNHAVVLSDLNSYAAGNEGVGIILDITNRSMLERASFVVKPLVHPAGQPSQNTSPQGERHFFSYHGSKLDLVRLKDDVSSRSHPRYECSRGCSTTEPLILEPEGPRSYDLDITLRASCLDQDPKVQHKEASTNKYAIAISFRHEIKGLHETLCIPWFPITKRREAYKFHVEKANRQLLIDCELLLMTWKLPTTFGESAVLLSAWWTQKDSFEDTSKTQKELLKGTSNGSNQQRAELVRCSHGQIYAGVRDVSGSEKAMLFEDDLFDSEPFRFFEGLFMLISGFDIDNNGYRQAILQYVGCYINRTTKIDDVPETVLTKVCRSVTNDNYAQFDTFLKALFDSPNVLWVPMPGLHRGLNPIAILLEKVNEVTRAVQLAGYVIDYCARMAKEKKDINFVFPVVNLLPEIVKQKKSQPDLVFRTLQGLAYIPAMERTTVLSRCTIAHPPNFLMHCKNFINMLTLPIPPSLSECENPVMRLDRSLFPKQDHSRSEKRMQDLPAVIKHLSAMCFHGILDQDRPEMQEPGILKQDSVIKQESSSDHHIHDVFVASFDMLWTPPAPRRTTLSPIGRITKYGKAAHSFKKTLLTIIRGDRVKDHEYTQGMLDNPAFAALIEYKWNTIGYKYWRARFIWQCLFYVLILVAVFIQIYDSTRSSSLMGVFITIVVMAGWLPIFQMQQIIYNFRGHGESAYAFMDGLARSIPLVASAIQIDNIVKGNNKGDISTLSFSVLLTFLHIVFELRVHKNVCHFVAIIVRIARKIQVFFLILAFGVLAFTIAILHLLRGCPVGDCEEPDVKFPSNFLKAISATYFFMGGVWDPVSGDFEKDNWRFHLMMIMYFFFTSIILLNVLIALMNVAFNDGDMTWELEWRDIRLQYIEIAETIAYTFPGYREAHHDIFPKEIYYVATRQEQNDYHAKYFQVERDGLVGGDSNGGSSISFDPQAQLKAQILALQEQLQKQQLGLEKQMEDIKEIKGMLATALATR